MIPLRSMHLALAGLTLTFGGTPGRPAPVRASAEVAVLRVIRTTPEAAATPTSEISVSFDRPVAGSLERTVDPATVMRIAPALEGRFEWRDPVTLRFLPARPLPGGGRFTITVGTGFTAMDGSRLAAPHEFAFRVRGPVVLEADPLNLVTRALRLVPNQRFDFVFSDSVDAARLEQLSYFEMASVCTPRIIRVRVGQQRRITDDDSYRMRDAGGWRRDRTADSLRRVVSLYPRAPLPRNCNGDLVLPVEVADGSAAGVARWPFQIFGPLQIEGVACGYSPVSGRECATGPLVVTFSTPVRGADVQRRLRIVPAVAFTVRDTSAEGIRWALEARLVPRSRYAVVADTLLQDVFGQRLTGARVVNVVTTGYEPFVGYPIGRQTVERIGFRTLPVQHVNADTLVALIAPVPDSLEPQFLARYNWGYGELWPLVAAGASEQRIPLRATQDHASITGVALPVSDASRPGAPTLFAVRVGGTAVKDGDRDMDGAVSLVQVTNLGVTARIGVEQGVVWVTGVNDGAPRAGARVTLHGATGQVLATATSDAQGIARLSAFKEPLIDTTEAAGRVGRPSDAADGGYVAVTLGTDRALVAANSYDPDLSSWAFGIGSAWGVDRFPMAGTVFTERGIYRPGEQVYAKAIVRSGSLGSLRRPAPTDSMRWVFTDREDNEVLSRTVALSEFGTADARLEIPANAAIGTHHVRIEMRRRGAWRSVGATAYRVAEYRPPEFLMDLATAARAEAPRRQPHGGRERALPLRRADGPGGAHVGDARGTGGGVGAAHPRHRRLVRRAERLGLARDGELGRLLLERHRHARCPRRAPGHRRSPLARHVQPRAHRLQLRDHRREPAGGGQRRLRARAPGGFLPRGAGGGEQLVLAGDGGPAAREPGDLQLDRQRLCAPAARIGKVRSRSR